MKSFEGLGLKPQTVYPDTACRKAFSGSGRRVQGIIINGCVRDTAVIGGLQLGVKALAPYPLKSSKRDPGLADVPVTFAGVRVSPGDWVYADGDGVLVSPEELKL